MARNRDLWRGKIHAINNSYDVVVRVDPSNGRVFSGVLGDRFEGNSQPEILDQLQARVDRQHDTHYRRAYRVTFPAGTQGGIVTAEPTLIVHTPDAGVVLCRPAVEQHDGDMTPVSGQLTKRYTPSSATVVVIATDEVRANLPRLQSQYAHLFTAYQAALATFQRARDRLADTRLEYGLGQISELLAALGA